MLSNGRSFDEGRRVLGLAFVEDSGEESLRCRHKPSLHLKDTR